MPVTPRQITDGFNRFEVLRNQAARLLPHLSSDPKTATELADAAGLTPGQYEDTVHYLREQGNCICGAPENGRLVHWIGDAGLGANDGQQNETLPTEERAA